MSAVLEVELGRLVAPRGPVFRDEARQAELRDSIRSAGLQRALDVLPLEDGSYELVDGVLRFGAVRDLGWSRVPARVHDVDAREASRRRLVLNAARRSVSPLEEARSIRHLLDEGDSLAEIQAALGRSRDWVRGRLRLLEQLEATLEGPLERGELTPTLALELTQAPPAWQGRLREAAREHGLGPRRATAGAPPRRPRAHPRGAGGGPDRAVVGAGPAARSAPRPDPPGRPGRRPGPGRPRPRARPGPGPPNGPPPGRRPRDRGRPDGPVRAPRRAGSRDGEVPP